MLGKIRSFLFFLIVFFISSQVGLHFWPDFAYVNGIRIDYLSPTLYLLDLLIFGWLGLFGIYLIRNKTNIRITIQSRIFKILLALFILGLLINIFLARSPGVHIFGMLKLGELGIFSILISKTFNKKDIPYFVDVLSLSAILSATLAIWQFFKQSSVGGLWYFLGERTFDTSTIGISTVNLGGQFLRPYGAFPHPNVLAFFLLMAIIFSIFRISYETNLYQKSLLIFSATLSSIALMLTFSRISIFLALCLIFYAIFTKARRNTRHYLFGGIGLVGILGMLFFPELLNSQFLLRGIDFRQELIVQSFQIFSSNPYFGIGFNNFFIHQAPLIKEISPIIFQPPHNIFVLALLSLGLFGFWIFPAVFILAVRSLLKKIQTKESSVRDFYKSIFIVLLSIIIAGMFDHFFLTLEQGQIILALIFGLSFAKLLPNTFKKRES